MTFVLQTQLPNISDGVTFFCMRAIELSNFRRRGGGAIWIILGRGSTMLAVGAGWGCLAIFSFAYLYLFLSHLFSQGAI